MTAQLSGDNFQAKCCCFLPCKVFSFIFFLGGDFSVNDGKIAKAGYFNYTSHNWGQTFEQLLEHDGSKLLTARIGTIIKNKKPTSIWFCPLSFIDVFWTILKNWWSGVISFADKRTCRTNWHIQRICKAPQCVCEEAKKLSFFFFSENNFSSWTRWHTEPLCRGNYLLLPAAGSRRRDKTSATNTKRTNINNITNEKKGNEARWLNSCSFICPWETGTDGSPSHTALSVYVFLLAAV